MSLLMALSGVLAPGAVAQKAPAQTPATQPKQNDHPKARGVAADAVVGGALTGNAPAGAVIGAGHSRRHARRATGDHKGEKLCSLSYLLGY